jgi:hypothetical protein
MEKIEDTVALLRASLDMRAWGNWRLFPPKLMQVKRSILIEKGGASREVERAGNSQGIMVEAEESGDQQTSDEDIPQFTKLPLNRILNQLNYIFATYFSMIHANNFRQSILRTPK